MSLYNIDIFKSLGMRKLIESGEYFKDARMWYNQIYVLPFAVRSVVGAQVAITVLLLALLAININILFPLRQQIRYAIGVGDLYDYAAEISEANTYPNDTQKSIAKVFVETFLKIREGYDYNDLADRMLYVQNTSTKVMYNNYNNYISLDNPESPVLRFQNQAKRIVTIKSINFVTEDNVIVLFNAKAYEHTGKNLEDTDWQATIEFNMDQVDIKQPAGTPFGFTVTDYNVKFIRDNNAK